MNNFWDERYSSAEYVYGEEPNVFVVEQLKKLSPGKILFPAEGEGRNAVFAASEGWDVSAFDPSIEGSNKALQLAAKKNVHINYFNMDYETAVFEKESFDCLVLVFAHMHSDYRYKYHRKLSSYLKPGGFLILEAFSKEQLGNNSGGPGNINMLYSKEELQKDFFDFCELHISQTKTILNEGNFHKGEAALIRVTGTK